MNAFTQLLLTELKFQWRHGFILAAVIVTFVWALLLSLLEENLRPFWFGLVAALDIPSIGLLFGFGLGVLDGHQKAIAAVRLTPIPSWMPALSRLVALSLLVILTLVILGLLILPAGTFTPMLSGIILSGCFYSAIGITAARRLTSLNQFMVFFALSGFIWALPVLYYTDIFSSWLWLLLPSGGSLGLLKHAWLSQPMVLLGLASALQLIWIALAFYLGERWAPLSLNARFGGH